MNSAVHRSPNKFWRYNSIFNLCSTLRYNTVSRVRACLSIWLERFRETQKENKRGPISIQSTLGGPTWPKTNGRGHCECYSSQKVTKIVRIELWIISWMTLDGGRECFDADNESVDTWQRATAVFTLHQRGGPCWLLKLRWMETQWVQMKRVLPWSFR